MGNNKVYEVKNSKGQCIALYESVGSTYKFTLRCDGGDVKKFKSIGDAYREYNKLAR